MNIKKITAFAAAVVMAAGICTGVPMGTDNVPPVAVVSEAAESKLAAPQNVKAKAGDGKVTLTWDEVKGAEAYRVYLYNAETKKYEKYKLIKGTKATVKDLENGKTYKFKVAAAVKSGKSYKTGTASAAVSAKPKAGKLQMKEISANSKNLLGTWNFYDISEKIKYTEGTKYNPAKVEWDGPEWTPRIQILSTKEAVIYYYKEWGTTPYATEIKNNAFVDDMLTKYKVYSYGDDKFLLVQLINPDGEYTYVFKYEQPVKNKKITDISKFEGKWTGVDFLSNVPVNYAEKYSAYNPQNKYWPESPWLAEATVKDGKINIKAAEGWDYYEVPQVIGKNDIAGDKYAVYEINGEMYLFFEFTNGDGTHTYVFKKN